MLLDKPDENPTILSEMISDAMGQQGLSIKGLRKKIMALDVPVSYEHTRRLVRGTANPGPSMLRAISAVLNVSFEDLHRAQLLGVASKTGMDDAVLEASGKDPSLSPLARVWKRLNDDQKTTVLNLARDLAKRNKEEDN